MYLGILWEIDGNKKRTAYHKVAKVGCQEKFLLSAETKKHP